MESEIKLKTVFNLKIARDLIQRKFKVVDVKINREDREYLVFYFESTPELDEAFDDIKATYLSNK